MSLRKLKRSQSKKSQKQLVSQYGTGHPAQLLQAARGFLQSGNAGEAEKVYKQIIMAFPSQAAAHNDLGALYHSQGKLKEAISHYKKAIAIDGSYPQALTNYGLVLKDQGNLAEAIAFFQRALAVNPRDVGALTNLGVARHEQGKLDDAITAYRQVLSISPKDMFALNNLAAVLRDKGDLKEAEALYQKVNDLYPEFIEAYIGLGLVYKKQARFDEAIASFRKALDIKQNYLDSWRHLAVIHTEQGNFDKASAAYEEIVKMVPDDFDAFTKLGILYQKTGKLDQALRNIKKALEINPEFLPARSGLVETLERYNKVEEAYSEALKALEIAPNDVSLNINTAICERRTGEFQKAFDRLNRVDAGSLDLIDQRQLFFELGRLYDRTGDYDKAYNSFLLGNRASQKINEKVDKNYFLNRIDILQNQFQECKTVPPSEASLIGRAPVFLIGFPRSGTTLLDQILDSHPKVQTMEEKDIMASLENKVADPFEEYLSLWHELTPDLIKVLQSDYFSKVGDYLHLQPKSILIDRMPLNIMRAALIWRVFPDAKFILAIRHSLDVCLSCFMQDFVINEANANFFTVDDAVNFYVKVMDLWRLYTELLPLQYHMVRYEDLVEDLEGEGRRLMDFLGVEWDSSALKFYEHAKAKGRIGTASYHQVTQAIYKHAKYRWLRYEKHLAPMHIKLAPLLDYFGYSE